MSTLSLTDALRLLALEQQAEQWALTVLRGTTFTDCLKMNGLAPTWEVVTLEGKTITIRGSDIYDSRTWKKFLAHANQGELLFQLTEVRERLAEQYKVWLLKEHTARYRVLSAEADLVWFERVVILAVTRHIMEQKYDAYVTKGQETFADPRTAIEMGKLLALNAIAKETARLVHHIVKEPAQAHHLIELFYEENYRQLQARSLPMQEAHVPSAAMPPLALQAKGEQEEHE
jgi:hypothetical protein